MKNHGNPMRTAISPAQRLFDALRCTAKSKRTGCPCKAPAVKGWAVCRMHGAGGGAPYGPANGQWKGGARSNEIEALRADMRDLVKESRDFAQMLGKV